MNPPRLIVIEHVDHPIPGHVPAIEASIDPPYAGADLYYLDVEWTIIGRGDWLIKRRAYKDGALLPNDETWDKPVGEPVRRWHAKVDLLWGSKYRVEFLLEMPDGQKAKDVLLHELHVDLTKPPAGNSVLRQN